MRNKNYKLKIKDNVDLKELKKFGFVFDTDDGIYSYTKKDLLGYTYIKIRSWDKKILFRQDRELYKDAICLCILYDLIQAGLVEKVGIKNG